AALFASASVHFSNILFHINKDAAICPVRDTLFNAFWNQYFMFPNFDSWKTTDKQCEILAILHALSGSINLINDHEGDYNHYLIKKICLPCGKILQADRILTLCKDSVFIDP